MYIYIYVYSDGFLLYDNLCLHFTYSKLIRYMFTSKALALHVLSKNSGMSGYSIFTLQRFV